MTIEKNAELQNAKQWFMDRGIDARIDDVSIFINVEGYEVMISDSEISYRSEIFKEESSN